MRGIVGIRWFFALLAALLLVVSGPAIAAIDLCDAGGSCSPACEQAGCDLPPPGDEGTPSCGHCAFGHSSQSLPQPTGVTVSSQFADPQRLYLPRPQTWRAGAPRDGPEHPPKA